MTRPVPVCLFSAWLKQQMHDGLDSALDPPCRHSTCCDCQVNLLKTNGHGTLGV